MSKSFMVSTKPMSPQDHGTLAEGERGKHGGRSDVVGHDHNVESRPNGTDRRGLQDDPCAHRVARVAQSKGVALTNTSDTSERSAKVRPDLQLDARQSCQRLKHRNPVERNHRLK